MQTETFLDRTDRLAAKMQVRVTDLPDVIGFSRAMLFAYRANKREPTRKALLKLEAAEREAGISRSLTKSESDSSLLDELRGAIDKAQAAEGLISELKRTLEKLIKKL